MGESQLQRQDKKRDREQTFQRTLKRLSEIPKPLLKGIIPRSKRKKGSGSVC